MVNTIDMQDMRYINLFGKITRIQTRFCFKYNEALVFCVPRPFVSKAIGEGGRNVKQLNYILKRKIKIIPQPNGIKDADKFIRSVVDPVSFRDLEILGDEIIITAGRQSKAALIGRNRRRLIELQRITRDFFGKDVKIV